MANVVAALGAAALPYVVDGVKGWVGNAVKTWAPGIIANKTIDAAEAYGAKYGAIGRIAGRVFGYMAAPEVAQATAMQSKIGLGGHVAAAAVGTLLQVGGSWALNRIAGKKQEEEKPQAPVNQQLVEQHQLLQGQLQMEMMKRLQEQQERIEQLQKCLVEKDREVKGQAEVVKQG